MSGAWVVETTRGTLTATVLVTAFGGLSEPRMPDYRRDRDVLR